MFSDQYLDLYICIIELDLYIWICKFDFVLLDLKNWNFWCLDLDLEQLGTPYFHLKLQVFPGSTPFLSLSITLANHCATKFFQFLLLHFFHFHFLVAAADKGSTVTECIFMYLYFHLYFHLHSYLYLYFSRRWAAKVNPLIEWKPQLSYSCQIPI